MAKRKNAKRAVAGLPAGFTNFAVGGGFGAWWNPQEQRSITGRVVGFDSMMVEDDDGKKKPRGIMRVQVENGSVFNVGESHAIKELFDKANVKALKGKQIYLEFLGQKKFKDKKGRARKINEFRVGISK